MVSRPTAVHVVTTTRRYKGKVYHAHLLRRSYREDGKVKNETIANLSHLPEATIDLIRRSLQGVQFIEAAEHFEIVRSLPHGNVQAVQTAMKALRFEELLGSRPCRERSLVAAMVAARILEPQSKLATTRWLSTTTLPEVMGVQGVDEDDLYGAMDWLLARQATIEKKLAARHLQRGGLVLYDLSSSYFEGTCCPLGKLGHSRDDKKGTLQVNYGLVTDAFGCPVAVSVFPGNTGDSTTLVPMVRDVQSKFGIDRLVIVGDRGMITQKQLSALEKEDGVDWITALRSPTIQDLVKRGHIQLGLFDERNLFEISHPDSPGERLVACRNPDLAELRTKKRDSLLKATKELLLKISRRVEAGKLRGKDKIGIAVGKIIEKHKVAKHFDIEVADSSLGFTINQERVTAEAALDGVYVIRTSLPKKVLSAETVVGSYKKLSNVERAFRSLKTVDLHVRPIFHWTEDRVRAHIFLCMLAYYVQYHMQEAWRSLLFFDEEAWTTERADPVAPAKRSASADLKAATKQTEEGHPVHSFHTLLSTLALIVKNECKPRQAANSSFDVITTPNPEQKRALEMLTAISA
jgi:transposase